MQRLKAMSRKFFSSGLQTCLVPITVLLVALVFVSCQQVVSIDLNKANPRIVIEGIITDQAVPDSVRITKSGDYFEPSLFFPSISNALVTISDNAGTLDTLKEDDPGTYRTWTLRGFPGRTYTLSATIDGTVYTAVSTMPEKVFIDSLYTTPFRAFDGDLGYYINISFQDPPTPGNYYRVNLGINRPIPSDSITGDRYHLFTDKLVNGNHVTIRLRTRRSVMRGDTLTVELLSIDKAAYDYYNTLNDILTSDRAPTSLAPTNPNTNLSNGSLGYFAAYTIDSRTIVLQ